MVILLAASSATGCGEADPIRTYKVAKDPSEAPPVAQQQESRMLAAIVPHQDVAWFFKLTGPVDAVAAQTETFQQFLKTVEFDGGAPQWQLPEGWQQQPGNAMRFATLRIPAEPPLEMSVTRLAMPPGDSAEYVLANINRWRGQLQLPPIDLEQLSQQAEQLEVAGTTATMVNLVGKASASDMSMGPFAGGPFSRGAADVPSTSSAQITYDKPEGWQQGELVSSRGGISIRREAAFTVSDGQQQAEVTVTRLPGSIPADLLAQVNRWRGQVGLDPIDQQQLDNQVQRIEVGGEDGQYVELEGPGGSILAVSVERQGQTWFFKLQGDSELAQREQEAFEDFVASVEFGGADGADHGQ